MGLRQRRHFNRNVKSAGMEGKEWFHRIRWLYRFGVQRNPAWREELRSCETKDGIQKSMCIDDVTRRRGCGHGRLRIKVSQIVLCTPLRDSAQFTGMRKENMSTPIFMGIDMY